MQAMKVEKDNACDRVDVCEEQCKAARVGGRVVKRKLPRCLFQVESCKKFFENYQDVFFKLRASKAEGEVEELTNKARQLETELDLTKENLGIATLKVATSKRISSS